LVTYKINIPCKIELIENPNADYLEKGDQNFDGSQVKQGIFFLPTLSNPSNIALNALLPVVE